MQFFSTLFLAVCSVITFAEAARPWYLDEVSSMLMKSAVDMRNKNVPESEASSIAKKIIDGALSPPQITPLAQSAANILIDDGTHVKPAQVFELVEKANAAYGAIRTSAGFKNFLEYISGQAEKFDLAEIEKTTSSTTSHGMSLRAMIQNELSKLSQDAQGRQAITGAKQLADTIARDAGLRIHF